MSLVVLALSVAAFLSARRLIRTLLLLAVLVQLLSLLIATILGFPADGVPLTFSRLEQSVFLASEYSYLLGFLLLVRDQPWRSLGQKSEGRNQN